MQTRVFKRVMTLMSAAALVSAGATAAQAADKVSVKKMDDRIRVEIGGKLFTDYIFTGHAKPILYPIIGPGGTPMTRNWPMKEGVEGEATDHPHQKSLWFTHGNVNGHDFWAEVPPKNKPDAKYGKAVQKRILKAEGGKVGVIQTENEWVQPDGKVALTDVRTITITPGPNDSRILDYDITLKATHGDVTFGETKEGTMGIRTHPALELKSKIKGKEATGKAVNSDGVEGLPVWGKQAKWVDYWGPIDGKTVGVAILEHPSNFRFPTYWHARDYGLIAANPFGIGDFDKSKPKGSGDHTIKSGQSLTLRYRFIFHSGDASEANIAAAFKAYAGK